ncbi:kinase-like protein [Sistotremastrum niveocremeum HHB9708]|uniref:Kinase-like protein n=1 Tax=Sistotremastrum niveocremeum HHB9708 TaxID=1314777 RepID=A0A164XBJ4_9AGAM|nr:kinase-like protein [Sistotremastrum niveocremeum HHB9708]
MTELHVDAESQDILTPLHAAGEREQEDYLLLVDRYSTFGIVDWGPGKELDVLLQNLIMREENDLLIKDEGYFRGRIPLDIAYREGSFEGWTTLTFIPSMGHSGNAEWTHQEVDLCLKVVCTEEQRKSNGLASVPPALQGYQLGRNPKALHDLTGHIIRRGDRPLASGGFADVWTGIWTDKDRPRKVAIKVIRPTSAQLPNTETDLISRRLRREIKVWQSLVHPNVVELLGICNGFGDFPAMVSLWYENGNIVSYISSLGKSGTLRLRMKLLTEVARGLHYLHEGRPPVVHGDIKGPNILIDENGVARLADFGLSKIEGLSNSVHFTTTTFAATVRWMALEMAEATSNDEIMSPTAWTDVWSYASLIVEILTGKIPYWEKKNDAAVLVAILRHIPPPLPPGTVIQPELRGLMDKCWSQSPQERPTMAQVLNEMERLFSDCTNE